MAKYIGSLTSDARGKVGGSVLTRGSNGTNLKSHGVGVNPASTYQSSLRSMFGQAASAWRMLTGPNRTSWELLASLYTYTNSLGQTYLPTGLQLWYQAWINASLSGSTPPSTAPTFPPAISIFNDMAVSSSGGALTWTASVALGPWFGSATLSASFPIPHSRNYTKGTRRRPMGFVLGGNSIEFSAAYIAAYGQLPPIGSTLSLRAVAFDTGSFITGAPALLTVKVTP